MERDRSRSGEPVRRTEERGRWREGVQRETEEARDRMEAERTERDRMERDRAERERMERERSERERRDRERWVHGETMGRGSGGSYLATRDPLLASHFDFMRQFMREVNRMFEGWGVPRGAGMSAFPGMGHLAQGDPASFSGTSPYQGQGSMLSGWPPIEVADREGQMVVRAELPGVDMQDVRVQLEGSVLVIEGERREDRKRERDGYYESEWSYGHFSRRIPVPQGVTPDQIRATCENGVLELRIDVPHRNVREIPIQRAGGTRTREVRAEEQER